MATVYIVCPRCSGSGYLPHYSHVQGGVCFKCVGAGIVKSSVSFNVSEIRVGSERIPVQPYFKMRRSEMIQVAARIFVLGPGCNSGLAITTLALVLGLADKTLRDRGYRAFDLRCPIEEDQVALRQMTVEVIRRWGCLRHP